MSADMSPYSSVHDEWLIMKLCMYVRYHDANNVLNFGGDPVTQLNLKTVLKNVYPVLRARRTIAVTRPLVLRLLLRDHAQAAGVWKTVAGHTSLSTALVKCKYIEMVKAEQKLMHIKYEYRYVKKLKGPNKLVHYE